DEEEKTESKTHTYYMNFLGLLEKSFNVNSSILIYKKELNKKKFITDETADIVFGAYTEKIDTGSVLEDYLVDKALAHQIPIYVSDEKGDPTATLDTDSDYIAAIPSVIDGELVAILAIKRMPFMSFNREILTSITILLEYFSIEISKSDLLKSSDTLSILSDREFRFEYARLHFMFLKHQVDSIISVFKIDNELQYARVHERVKKMLRSLDKVTTLLENGFYYVVLLFPLHDKAAAEGYYNRLIFILEKEEKRDSKFDFMFFSMDDNSLLNKYLREDYDS
ncbi:MAG: PelD GGDEF domain-containing protein, partial [Campylobacterota bacterium]|nr:PelD GGDEF domain-containing protein [Campylobacterota bacterium]